MILDCLPIRFIGYGLTGFNGFQSKKSSRVIAMLFLMVHYRPTISSPYGISFVIQVPAPNRVSQFSSMILLPISSPSLIPLISILSYIFKLIELMHWNAPRVRDIWTQHRCVIDLRAEGTYAFGNINRYRFDYKPFLLRHVCLKHLTLYSVHELQLYTTQRWVVIPSLVMNRW